MAEYPALDIPCTDLDSPLYDRLYALLDDYEPIGIQPIDGGIRVFFRSASMRDQARRAVAQREDVLRAGLERDRVPLVGAQQDEQAGPPLAVTVADEPASLAGSAGCPL